MALIDRVKYDALDDSLFVWKYPSEALKIGSQVIVNQSQKVVFVKGGEVLDVLEAGTHTLNTGNIPLLDKIINFPFGGDTPFTAEVWYVNLIAKRDLKWGTPQPIQLLDPQIGFPMRLRAFGQWGVRIENPRSFVMQLVGSQTGADASKVHSYFIGEINQKLTHILSNAVIGNKLSILNINTAISQLSELVLKEITMEFNRFGVEVINFNIESINIPEEDLAKIQNVFEKKMEVEQLSKVEIGGAYAAVKSFDILGTASENAGDGGSSLGDMLGVGIGLGAGLPLGQQLGQQMQVEQHSVAGPKEAQDSNSPKERLKLLKELFMDDIISSEEFEKRKKEILSEI